ncbi:MAG: twin-arginine translocase TatA/TatE family subunit [Pseudomonadota bacterium]|jgi:sec-independent protein translocase protein TatA
MLGNISFPQLLILLVIVIMLFGTKRLRNLGGDLGSAIKGFKQSMKEETAAEEDTPAKQVAKDDDVIDVTPEKTESKDKAE